MFSLVAAISIIVLVVKQIFALKGILQYILITMGIIVVLPIGVAIVDYAIGKDVLSPLIGIVILISVIMLIKHVVPTVAERHKERVHLKTLRYHF